ncbi:MAG: hypothetical protein WC836_19755 [Desulfobacula sp.]|jgi:hypothetical protein
MNPSEVNRFNRLYEHQLKTLKLQGNAEKLLFLVQLILHVRIMAMAHHPRPAFKRPHCGSLMIVVGVRPATNRSG